jgi:hypothetical protein
LRVLASVIALLAVAAQARAQAPPAEWGSVSLDVLDARSSVTEKLGHDLLLQIRKEAGADGPVGWTVEVTRRGHAGNLLYHSRQWHGPHPSQVYAWSEAARLWPARRELAVRGRPWRVTVSCEGCVVRGEGPSATFLKGVLCVSWARTVDEGAPLARRRPLGG